MKTFARICATLTVALSCLVCSAVSQTPPQVEFTQTFAAPDKYAVPAQSIVGPEGPIALGELVDLSLSPISPKPAYLVEARYTWKVFDTTTLKEIKIREDGTGVYFGAGVKPRTLKVICAASYLYVSKDGNNVEAANRQLLLLANVVIGEPPPVPAPTPTPTPPAPAPTPVPAPVLPEGQFGLAKTVFDFANTKVLDVNNRTKGSQAVAVAYKGVASSIDAGAIKKLDDGLKQAKASSLSALGRVSVDPATWDDFGAALEKVLYQLYKDKKLNTPADLSICLKEIAQGLDSVK